MARTFLTNIDANWHEILKLRLQNLAAEPATPQPGWIFFDTATDSIKIRNAANTAWIVLGVGQTLDAEQVEDIAGAMVSANTETGITVTYDDVAGKLNFAVTDSPLLGGQNSAYHLSRANHTGTQTSATISDFTEAAQDASASMLTAGLHTNITTTYDDLNNRLAIAVTGLTSASLSDFVEAAQDAVGTILTNTVTVGFTYDDVANTISAAVLDSPTVGGATPAQLRDRTTHTGTQTAATISDFSEAAQDAAAAMLTGATHTNISTTYDDLANTLTLAVTGLSSANVSDFSEASQDATAAAFAAGTHTNATITYNDVANSLSVAVTGLASTNISDFTEAAQDSAASMITGATHTKITATYNDAANTLALAVSGLVPADITGFDTQVRTSRLDQMAVPAANVAMGGFRLTGLGTPTADGDAANKAYVDAARSGLDVKASVRAATTTSIANLSSASVVHDGITLVAGDRLLVKNGASPDGVAAASDIYNGIYVVGTVTTGTAPLTRADDADTNAEVTAGMFTFVESGTVNADTGWVLGTDNPITLGTTALTFVKFSSAGDITAGGGLIKAGNDLAVGAGTGMVVNADDVAVLRTDANGRVPLRYAANVGDGVATTITVTHNLNSLDVVVALYRVADGVEVECDVTRSTANSVILGFATAPTAAQYRVVVIG